ncbi:sulfotransferase family protein [Candidatus Laterigemmans baculatus]|uniref:sulfotransferase family protein n=1 Tax=Candidatus Laterigemmans baculatus TaxID=2770505 RepID=UPI0013DAFB4D|nr:sulfotransferase [Candidatus Laterigemmans baculatus]
MRARTWWGLLRANRFRVDPSRVPMALLLSLETPINDLLGWLQQWRHGAKLEQTELAAPPIFIVGHWRSGTTLLHELMMLDPRLSYPTTYQCFAPSHFLVSEWFFRSFGNWLLPNKRPMDNVAAGWDRPQEDEFALMNLGLPSPYRRIAFPRQPAPDMEYLDFAAVDEMSLRRWLSGLHQFLTAVTLGSDQGPRRLVLKSPTHTGRVGVLADYFAGAKFIHITRDPRSLYPSTRRLWTSLDLIQGLQKPPAETDREYVLSCLERMYAAFHADRDAVPPGSIIDIRYEDLVADPVGSLRDVYQALELGDFAPVERPLQSWVEENHRGYKPNEHRLPEEDEALIQDRWSDYFARYGYR